MDWGALAQAISGAVNNVGTFVGSIASIEGQKNAADRMEATSAEKQRRLQLEQNQILGQAQASAAASGVGMSSPSISTYLDSMKSEMARQAEWTRQSSAQEVSDMRSATDWQLGGSIAMLLLGGSSSGSAAAAWGSMGNSKDDPSLGKGYDDVWNPQTHSQAVRNTGSQGDFNINTGSTRGA